MHKHLKSLLRFTVLRNAACCATRLNCVRLSRRKIPVNLSQQLYPLSFSLLLLLLFFFFLQRPTGGPRDMSNCTKSVCSFSFAGHVTALHHSGALSFSFPCYLPYSWWLCSSCDSRNEVWFITEDVSIIDQTKRGVGTPLFGLARYDSFFEQGIPVFKDNWVLNRVYNFTILSL